MKKLFIVLSMLPIILLINCSKQSLYYESVIYYSGSNDELWRDYSIGVAFKDGNEITKYEDNPILKTGKSYDSLRVKDPFILELEDSLIMYYTGHNIHGIHTINVAESGDGINWSKYKGNPIMEGDTIGWDGKQVCRASVYDTKIDGEKRFRMLYCGLSESGTWSIGYAYSADGYEWVRGNEPVIPVGKSGEWDSLHITSPSEIIKCGDTYHVYYSGHSSEVWQIGLVTFDDFEGEYIKSEYNPVLSPRVDAIQAIEEKILVGNDTIKVKDPSVFEEGELVFLYNKNNSDFELNRVIKIDEGVLELENETSHLYNSNSIISSWMSKSVAWCGVQYDGRWEMMFTAFQSLYDEIKYDRRIVSYAHSKDGVNWIIDYELAPYIPYENIEGSWDRLMVSDAKEYRFKNVKIGDINGY